MKSSRKFLATLMLGALGAGGWYVGSNLVQNVQFAHAVEQVDATRQELQKVEDIATVFRKVGKTIEPSVVNIEVTKTVHNTVNNQQIPDDFLRRFFPDRDGDGQPDLPEEGNDSVQRGEGSGVIVEAANGEAYVVTNNHVAGGAKEMTIKLADGREINDATLVGADPKSDIAVVKFKADRLITAQWGNSDDLEKGDFILAFGSPFGYIGSMTHGIVSALNRQADILGPMGYENFIQVDCPINPGNSGGPLVNLKGEIVGINTAIASRTGGFQGIGLAIPSNQVKDVYQQIRNKGSVVRGWLGVEIAEVSKQKELAEAVGYTGDKGILVKGTTRGTPADGKLQSGDVILSMNGNVLTDMRKFRDQIARTSPNTEVTFNIIREGKPTDVKVTIGQQPDDLLASAQSGRRPQNDNTASAGNIGVRLSTPTADEAERLGLQSTKGALITEVQQGSLASGYGLQVGDLITRVGDTPIATAKEASDALAKQDLRKGAAIYVTGKGGSRLVFVKMEK